MRRLDRRNHARAGRRPLECPATTIYGRTRPYEDPSHWDRLRGFDPVVDAVLATSTHDGIVVAVIDWEVGTHVRHPEVPGRAEEVGQPGRLAQLPGDRMLTGTRTDD